MSGWCASSAVTRLVSLVAAGAFLTGMSSSPKAPESPATRVDSSWVLVRLPLCASAIDPVSVGRDVGWALGQALAPGVEDRAGPPARRPLPDSSGASSRTEEPRPLSLQTRVHR